jgi:hypothetical protein
MITEVMSSIMESIYPIYARPLEAKWRMVIRDAVEACECKIDKLDVSYTLDSFAVEEDAAFKTITLSGAAIDIRLFQRNHLDLFKASFHKEFPGYRFKFEENKNG